MSSRIIMRDRVVYVSPDFNRIRWDKGRVPEYRDDPTGEKDCTSGIPPKSPKSPYRAGLPVRDSAEGITYRCVQNLNPLLGWAGTEFWQKRWDMDHKAIISFVEHGYLDAGVEVGSQVRRYRCRDEYALKRTQAWKAQRRREAERRKNSKRLTRARLVQKAGGWLD